MLHGSKPPASDRRGDRPPSLSNGNSQGWRSRRCKYATAPAYSAPGAGWTVSQARGTLAVAAANRTTGKIHHPGRVQVGIEATPTKTSQLLPELVAAASH